METDTELAAIRLQLTQISTKLDFIIRSMSNPNNTMGQPLGAKQAAGYLHISVSRLYSLVSEGTIKPMQQKKGGRILFSGAQLNEYLASTDNLKRTDDECD